MAVLMAKQEAKKISKISNISNKTENEISWNSKNKNLTKPNPFILATKLLFLNIEHNSKSCKNVSLVSTGAYCIYS